MQTQRPIAGDAPVRPAIAAIDSAFHMRLGDHPSAEAQLANMADDIAYLSHDFDDALRADLFTIADIARCWWSAAF